MDVDLEDKIKPALNLIQGKALSADEFQRLLFEYFEDKGIMSDLRAHLRTQMIHVLKETCLGQAIMTKKNEISPKLQALNLLIAEYLLQRNYHYTLSVLSSEVPLTNAFPPMTIEEYVNAEKKFRFAEEDMWDILEAIGITKVPDLAHQLCTKYKQREKESLLTCILHNIPGLIERSDNVKSERIKTWLQRHDLKSMDLELLIRMFKETGIEIEIILQIIEQLKVVITNEVRTLRQLKDQELTNMKQKLNYETSCKLQKYKVKFASLETFYKAEKKRLEVELQQTKDNLKETARNVQDRYKDVNELNEHIKGLERRLRQQEQTLLSKEQTLQQRQEYLESKQKRIDKQFDELLLISQTQQIALAATNEPTRAGANAKVMRTSETQNVAQCVSQYCETVDDRDKADVLKQENVELKNASNHLQEEISALKGQNLAYQTKIQELLLRTNSLLGQLEVRNEVRRYHFAATDPNVAVSQIPSTSTFPSPSRTRYIPSYHGGGEEGNRLHQMSPSEFRHLQVTRRKKTPRSVIQTSSSGEMSPTDDILKEARERLLELEKESDAIDLHFDTFSKSNVRTSESTKAASIIQNFQSNVAMIRNSLSKIFTTAETKSLATHPSTSTVDQPMKPSSTKVSSLIAEGADGLDELAERFVEASDAELEGGIAGGRLTIGIEGDDLEREDIYNSATSSGMIINTSISTLDLTGLSSSVYEWLDIGKS